MITNEQELVLINFIESRQQAHFEWGKHDCSLFVADAIEAVTGQDHASEYRGQYKSFKTALKALKTYGKGDLKQTMTHKFGEPVAPLQAQNGDVVLLKNDEDDDMLGVVFQGVWVVGGTRLLRKEMDDIVYAWRVI